MSDPVTVQKFAMGQSVSRLEDPRLVQGLGRYSDDVNLPRQAYAAVVRSPHAHARIAGIDPAAALRAPGVLAVLTGADLAADGVGNLPSDGSRKRRDGSPAFRTPRPALARERVRHVGDPVALVVATSPEAAADAAELVAVDYAPLPAVSGAVRATAAGAPAVWAEAPDNVAFVWEAGSRDAVARAFAQAAHVSRLDFVVTRVAAAPLEPRAAVGEFDRRGGRYTLHTGIQGPHGLRALLAEQIFRVPHGQVRVVTGEVGGSFGMRSGIYPELVLVLWAARRLGRPVKWTSSRREGFLSDEHGRDNVTSAELALDANGRFPACGSRSRSTSAPTSPSGARAPRPTTWAASPACTPRPPSTSRAPVCSPTPRRPARTAGPGAPRPRTRSSGSSTWRRASSASTRSSCGSAT
jgi:carbon-monoxide dehydrogenase large subunit